MRRLSTCLIAAFLGSVVVAGPAPAQSQTNTTSEQIQVWNTSLKLVDAAGPNDETRWKAAFKQMASASQYQYRPDLMTILEVPYQDQTTIKNYVENTLGAQYGSVHSDYGVTFCENNRSRDCGNTLLMWRNPRFNKVSTTSGYDVVRWAQLIDKNGDGDCDDSGDVNKRDGAVIPDQVVARLRDDAKGNQLVFSGVHFAADQPVPCLVKNLKKVSDLFERTWSNRPLTVVTGDLNERVDIHAGDAGYSNSHWRQESDTACWYEEFSALHAERSICQTFSSHYYDAIWAENAGSNPGSGICAHWTFGNFRADYASANDCSSDHGRIDFVWIRYEGPNGARLELSLDEIRAKIEEAGADRGYFQPSSGDPERYSDHRALHTRIRW